VLDPSGLGTASGILVTEEGALTNTTVCSQTNVGTAATTFICNLGNSTDKSYTYYVYATIEGQNYIIQTGTFGGTQTILFGSIGYFLALLVVMGIGVAGLFNPAAFIVMTVMGVISAFYFGFFPLAGFGMLIGFALFGIIVALMVKT
jgi:hypothetical protein